jgi:hypothetical protein
MQGGAEAHLDRLQIDAAGLPALGEDAFLDIARRDRLLDVPYPPLLG